jgi:2-phospho-L-lactate guanylyltransferase
MEIMSTWVVIPVKPLRLAKSRLAKVLTPDERQQLAEVLLRHVLQTVNNVPEVTGTLVISRDNRVLTIAREYKARTVQETGNPELNAALLRAAKIIESWGSDSILILPADLPVINAEDVSAIIKLGKKNFPSVVIATDRIEDGTNALFVRPPGCIGYAYGPGSFQRHMALAKEASAHIEVYHSERLQFDIDMPEDLQRYYQLTATKSTVPPFSLITPPDIQDDILPHLDRL